ncbi:MAG: polymorphic toxin type 33 domain-containing protein [Chloroflexota bacterium]
MAPSLNLGGGPAGDFGGRGGRFTPAPQLKRLSNGEIKFLKREGISAEALKEEYGCGSECDLYKDKRQQVCVAPKNNLYAAQRTYVNLRELRRSEGS